MICLSRMLFEVMSSIPAWKNVTFFCCGNAGLKRIFSKSSTPVWNDIRSVAGEGCSGGWAASWLVGQRDRAVLPI